MGCHGAVCSLFTVANLLSDRGGEPCLVRRYGRCSVSPYRVLQSNRPKISDTVARTRAISWIKLDSIDIWYYTYWVLKVFKIPIRQRTEVDWHVENLTEFITTNNDVFLPSSKAYIWPFTASTPEPGVCTFWPPHVQRLGDGCVTAWSLESAGLLPGPRILSGSRTRGKKWDRADIVPGLGAWTLWPSFHKLYCVDPDNQIVVKWFVIIYYMYLVPITPLLQNLVINMESYEHVD